MPQLDRFLSALAEYKAEALVLEQDQAPAFRFLSETKTVSKAVLTVDRILELVRELGATEAVEECQRDGKSTFLYQVQDTSYSGMLQSESGKVVVTMWESDHPEPGGEEDYQAAAIAEQIQESSGESGAKSSAKSKPNKIPSGRGTREIADTHDGEINLPSLADHTALELIPDDLPANYRQRMDDLLRSMIDRGASDLHLCVGSPPVYRIDGDMRRDDKDAVVDADDLFRMLFSIAPKRNRDEFVQKKDTDCAYSIDGLSRFRCNFYFDRNGPGAVFRAIPGEVIDAKKLGLPKVVQDLAKLNKGLVLVTGPTGSGKSTTLAALIDIVNRSRKDHVITIEDPVEFVHENQQCLINQREVGAHTSGFKTALRAALREDPDVILVGELRDLETVAMAIETAETGHLVFATVHTTTASSTVDRLIDQFPPEQQAQVRVMLSESLRAVVAQTLCKKKGGGRVAAFEILVGTNSVANLIREGKTFQLESSMQTGKKQGMQTFNDHLLQLVQKDEVEAAEAYLKAVDKQGLLDAFARNGIDYGGE